MGPESPVKLAPFSILVYNRKNGEREFLENESQYSSFLDLALTPSVVLRSSGPVSLVSLPHITWEGPEDLQGPTHV